MTEANSVFPSVAPPVRPPALPVRLKSADLFGDARAIQIEHGGKIYELRLTRLNKLILTA